MRRTALAPTLLGRQGHGIAQVPQEHAEHFLFVDLGQVVDLPVGLGFWSSLNVIGGCLGLLPTMRFPLEGVGSGVDVLARFLAFLEVWAGAERLVIQVHDIGTVVGLRGNLVTQPVPFDRDQGGDGQAALLPALFAVVRVVGAKGRTRKKLLRHHT